MGIIGSQRHENITSLWPEHQYQMNYENPTYGPRLEAVIQMLLTHDIDRR